MGDNREESAPYDRSTRLEKPQQLSNDKIYQGLASTRRRRLLYVLREETECTVDDLAEILTEWEDANGNPSPDDHKKVRIKLVHSDLPLLADAELIAYDRENQLVRAEPLHPLFEAVISRSIDAEAAP
mgnify:CR=1 FL=1